MTRHLQRPFQALLVVLMALACGSASASCPIPNCSIQCGTMCNGEYDCGPCSALCGNGVCQPGIGETAVTCPLDCSPQSCQSEGCAGRCGLVTDNCGVQLHCGTCNGTPQCGNARCEAGEVLGCPEDCENCQPRRFCGIRCGDIDDGCGGTLECGPCGGTCGNNVCESWNGETHSSCSSDCAPAGCVPASCGNHCGLWINNCGVQVNCGPCSALCANPNGVCEPALGEDPEKCPTECDSQCGNGTCDYPLEELRCPIDCSSSGEALLTAGGPYSGVIGTPIAFHAAALTPGTTVASYSWSFGDGGTATGQAPTHTYTQRNHYAVQVTAITATGVTLTANTSASVSMTTPTGGCNPCVDGGFTYFPGIDQLYLKVRASYVPFAPEIRAYLAVSIADPDTLLVYQGGPTEFNLNGEREVTHNEVPAFTNPKHGMWGAVVSIAVIDPTAYFPPQFYNFFTTAFVDAALPSCTGCVVLQPSEVAILDGETTPMAAGWPGQPNVTSWQWSASKVPGAGAGGAATFQTNGTPNVVVRGTWYPKNPGLQCPPPGDQVGDQMKPRYGIHVAATPASGMPGTGDGGLEVKMPWGMPFGQGGTGQPAARTYNPNIGGDLPLYNPECTNQVVTNSCHVVANRWERTQPWIDFHIPVASSFRNKVVFHEGIHEQQFISGMASGLWNAAELYARVVGMTANSAQELDQKMDAARVQYESEQLAGLTMLAPAMECAAYSVSDQLAPTYLLQRCVARPDLNCQ